MTNEQRAHDITMLYVEIFTKVEPVDENGQVKLDPYSRYKEIYPAILEEVNKDFPQ